MKKPLFLLTMAGLALFGFGCRPTTPPPAQPAAVTPAPSETPITQPTTIQPVINWKTYTDTANGFSFQYPQAASATDWNPSSGPLSLSAYPTHEGHNRRLTLRTSTTPNISTGSCGAYQGLNGANVATGTQEMMNGVPFCLYSYSDGAAGHTGSYFDYVTLVGSTQVTLSFLDFHVTDPRIYAECEDGTSSIAKCGPYDPRTDAQIFRQIIATFKLSKPVAYAFKDVAIKETQNSYEIDVTYPTLNSTADPKLKADFDAAMKKIADDQVSQFRTDYVANIDPKQLPDYPGTLALHGNVEGQKVGEYISVLFDGSLYTNGAHPNSLYAAALFDVKSHKLLKLSDILRHTGTSDLNTLATMSRTQLAKLDSQQVFSDVDWLNGGTDPKQPQNFQFFYFTPKGMTIVFPPYQVAAYAAGPQRVDFSYAEVKNLIKDRFLP